MGTEGEGEGSSVQVQSRRPLGCLRRRSVNGEEGGDENKKDAAGEEEEEGDNGRDGACNPCKLSFNSSGEEDLQQQMEETLDGENTGELATATTPAIAV